MKTSWTIEAGALRITIKDGRREQSWALRQSHKPEVLANAFAEIAEALGARAIMPHEAPLSPLVEKLMHSTPVGYVDPVTKQLVPLESPERKELRRQAQAALAGARVAKAIESGDEGSVAALPEIMGRESENQVTSTAGFNTLEAASVAVDGTVYKAEDYRADKSNWIK